MRRGILLTAAMSVAWGAADPEPAPFRLSLLGCPMAHCDPAMSDHVLMRAPSAVSSIWSDATAESDETGLGCSATPFMAVCTFGPAKDGAQRPQVKAYNATGKVLWDSGDVLNGTAWTSVPILSRNGEAIATDDQSLVRFSADGRVVWKSATPGGRPISPTLTQNGAVVLATIGGPISVYKSDTGELVGQLDLRDTLGGLRGRFETTNTPGTRGNRVYISTEFKLEDGGSDPNHHGRLYAVDVDPAPGPQESVRVAWFYEFGARSGASPLVIGDRIYFDGDRASPSGAFAPRFFAVRDEGSSPRLLWDYATGGPAAASAARDPRGGLWVFALGATSLVRLSEKDGALLDTIDLPSLTGVAGARPWSGIGITHGRKGQPVLIVSARTTSAAWVIAIDVTARSLIWKAHVGSDSYGDLPRGQWPILAGGDGKRVLVFTTRNGVRALGGPL